MKWAWVGACGVAMLTTWAVAGRPLVTDDAEPVAHRQFELEAGVFYAADSDVQHVDVPLTLSYGLLPRLEIGAGFGGQWEQRDESLGIDENASGISDLVLGTKWKYLDQEQFLAHQALSFAVKLPTASEDDGLGSGEVDWEATWILTREISERLLIDFNLGYTNLGDPDNEDFDDLIRYGIALEYLLTERLQPVAEFFGETPIGQSHETSFAINGGIRWLVAENLVLDAGIGTGIRGEAPDVFATVGLTWTF